MTDPLEPAIEAGLDASVLAYDEVLNAKLGNPPGSVMGEGGRRALAEISAYRAAITAAVRAAAPIIAAQAVEDEREQRKAAEARRDDLHRRLSEARVLHDTTCRLAGEENRRLREERDELDGLLTRTVQELTALAGDAADLRSRLATAEKDRDRARRYALLRAADGILAELICCDVYERDKDTDRAGEEHAICFWSGAARAIVLAHAERAAMHGKGSGDE